MSKQLIMVGSITYAMKGKELLLKYGIRASVERTPKKASNTGCGYGLYVPDGINNAVDILTSNGIRVTGIFGGVMPP